MLASHDFRYISRYIGNQDISELNRGGCGRLLEIAPNSFRPSSRVRAALFASIAFSASACHDEVPKAWRILTDAFELKKKERI
jgi:hypothetical protein